MALDSAFWYLLIKLQLTCKKENTHHILYEVLLPFLADSTTICNAVEDSILCGKP